MTRDRTISRSSSALAYAALATMILSLRAPVNKVYALVSRMALLRSIPIYNSGRWRSSLPGSDRQVLAERYVVSGSRLADQCPFRRPAAFDVGIGRLPAHFGHLGFDLPSPEADVQNDVETRLQYSLAAECLQHWPCMRCLSYRNT